MQRNLDLTLGALPVKQAGYGFKVWAPFVERMAIELERNNEADLIVMQKDNDGYFNVLVNTAQPGDNYLFCFDDKKIPDPASRYQPQGVFGASQLVDQKFPWTDQKWHGLAKDEYVIYELHVGTYTHEGTFDAILQHLPTLKEFGISAIELMPVAQFPGERNWGYDGVFPFAVQNSYGGPNGLKRLVNACHKQEIAVILDVVYNHLGPEGNYFKEYGPYFTDFYKSPWGEAINFDGSYSHHVRRYFIENALHWFREYHIDALRLDALHAIFDRSAYPFLRELADHVHDLNSARQKFYLIAETDLNDPRLINPPTKGGFGLDAQWNDEFHHALHTLLTNERSGYYQDFGELKHFVKAYAEGYVYSGEVSSYRKRPHGTSSKNIPANKFVVFVQNHDQVGNRFKGDRLSSQLNFQQLKLAAGILLLAPNIPLLFMGEEYGETAPFLYFISHHDDELIRLVREGRKKEFASFGWTKIADPQSQATFAQCKLQHELRQKSHHKNLWEFQRELLRLRKHCGLYRHLNKGVIKLTSDDKNKTVTVLRQEDNKLGFLVFNFNAKPIQLNFHSPFTGKKIIDSHDETWGGEGSHVPQQLKEDEDVVFTLPPFAFVFFIKDE